MDMNTNIQERPITAPLSYWFSFFFSQQKRFRKHIGIFSPKLLVYPSQTIRVTSQSSIKFVF